MQLEPNAIQIGATCGTCFRAQFGDVQLLAAFLIQNLVVVFCRGCQENVLKILAVCAHTHMW